MSYKILIRSEEDYKWLKKQMKDHYERSIQKPELYLEYADMYKRLHEDFSGAEKVKDDWMTLEDFKKKDQLSKKRAATMDNWGYCKEHPKYAAKRAPRTDCDVCWHAYEKLNHGGKQSPQRRAFLKRAGS